MKSKCIKAKTLLNRLPIIFGLFFITNWSIGQQTTVEDIKIFEGAGEIENVGYYSFYQADGERGKMRNYTLKFFDFDYNIIGNEKIELSKRATLTDSESNKSHLAIAVGDSKLKQLSIRSFDKSGNLAGKLDIETSKLPSADLYESSNGFIIVNKIRQGMLSTKMDFEIIAVDNELNIIWKKTFDEDENVIEIVDILSKDGSTAVVYSTGRGMKKESYHQNLLRLSKSGETVFNTKFANNYFYFPNKILIQDDNTFVFGSFPEEGKSKPAGVFAIAFSNSGDIVMKNEINYEKQIGSEIEDILSEEDINMKENPQFIVNDVIKTDEGFYLITETIRLRPSIGVGAQVSSGGGSGASIQVNTAFIMGDFLILKLKKDLELERIKVVTKDKNKIIVEGTVFNVNQYYRIIKMRNMNVSNYQFWITNKDGNPAMVYTIRKSYRSNIKVGVVDITTEDRVTESNPVVSELEKLKEVGVFGVLRNRPGNLSVLIYKRRKLSFYELSY